MIVKDYISHSFPTVNPYCGINSIAEKLLEKDYLVVTDESGFVGILTPNDLIKRPHKLVIDCLSKKDILSDSDTVSYALDKMYYYQSVALPVFQNEKFIGIIEKKDILKALTQRIDELYGKSIISEKLKSQFLANLSHEIRTPMNAIIGFLDILSNMDLEDYQNNKDYLDIVKNSADHFLIMMNDLVELSVINAGGNLKISEEHFLPENIFAELKEYFEQKSLYKNKIITISYINPDPSLRLFGDVKKIKHILFHLIDNAVKFSGNGNKILFGLTAAEDSSAHFFVTNTGSSVEEEDKDRIFEIFEKNRKNDFPYIEGLGLGLTVVKKITELLGGNIGMISENNNQTTFTFSIPVARVEFANV